LYQYEKTIYFDLSGKLLKTAMKTKQLFITIFMFTLWANLFAQDDKPYCDRDMADSLVFDYMQREEIPLDYPWKLYRMNDNVLEEDSTTTLLPLYDYTTESGKSLSINYKCWVYLLDMWAVNGAHPVIILIIDKYNFSTDPLLEIKIESTFPYSLHYVGSWTRITELHIGKETTTKSDNVNEFIKN
jgi:hypothetical protein